MYENNQTFATKSLHQQCEKIKYFIKTAVYSLIVVTNWWIMVPKQMGCYRGCPPRTTDTKYIFPGPSQQRYSFGRR